MSIRQRLLFITIGLSFCIIALLTGLQINDLATTWIDDSLEIARSAAQQAKVSLLGRLENQSAGSLADTKRLLVKLAEGDRELPQMLEKGMARSATIIEISVADGAERIVASSDPSRKQRALNSKPSLEALRQTNAVSRLISLLKSSSDYELRLPIGITGEKQPVFLIQVLVSPALLRDVLTPRVRSIAGIAGAMMTAAILLSIWLSNLMLRNITRLGEEIDRIASGETPVSRPSPASGEFALVETKLSMLGQQFRGFQNVIEKLEDAVLVFDGSRRLVLCGNPARRLLGEIETGRKLEELSLGAALADVFKKGTPVKDWPVGNLLADVEFFPGGTIVRVRDPEGRKQLESELQLSNRLAAVQRLTGGVAHEIKNPLNSITLLLEVLKMKSPESAEEVNVISEEVRRLDRVVRTFLEFSRPVELDRKSMDASELVRDILKFLLPDADKRGIHVFESLSKAMISADKDLLRQALLNILMNALEAMPDGGELRVSCAAQSGECVIRVQDSGTGIPQDKLDKIFQLYYTTKQNGSGIGLAQTFRAVQLHGGRIQVDSQKDKGTVFTIFIPLVGAAA